MSEFDPTDLTDELERTEEASAAAEQEARWEVDDWRWLIAQKRGRRIVWRLLSHAGLYRSSFSPDAFVTAFNEGQRNSGLRLAALLLAHCSDDYALMTQERSNV